jgi:hypothetical protein
MRVLILVLAAISFLYSQNTITTNHKGFLDTAKISTILGTTTTFYTKALPLTDGEDLRTLLKVYDPEAGFAADSINLHWGYQTGCATLSYSGTIDTSWHFQVILDTMTSDSLGKKAAAKVDSTGALIRGKKMIDTSSVSGFAVQESWFVPEWNELIRYWVKGIGSGSGDTCLFVFEQHQRNHVRTGK